MTDGEKYAFALATLKAIYMYNGGSVARNAIDYLEKN